MNIRQSFTSNSRFTKSPVDLLKLQEIFSSIYDKYSPALYGVLIRWAGDESIAQLMLQQTFKVYLKEHQANHTCDTSFICLLKIARREWDIYLKKSEFTCTTTGKEYSSIQYEASLL